MLNPVPPVAPRFYDASTSVCATSADGLGRNREAVGLFCHAAPHL